MANFPSVLLSVLGLLASIVGGVLAYFTFVDPRKRLSHYLDKIDQWESISTTLGGHEEIWRYNKHPEFTVEITDDSKDWDPGAKEPWITMPLPDPKKTMYMVHASVNGTVLYAEKFIALDGWRYFIPIPRIKIDRTTKADDADYDPDNYTDNREFYYDKIQLQLSRIIGKLHGDRSIDEFARHHKIQIQGKKK